MFDIALERHATAPVSTVTASGVLDGRSADHLAEMLRIASGTRRVVIDLADVNLVDAIGLRTLLGAIRSIREAGQEVELIATDSFTNVLRESGVTFRGSRLEQVVDRDSPDMGGDRDAACSPLDAGPGRGGGLRPA